MKKWILPAIAVVGLTGAAIAFSALSSAPAAKPVANDVVVSEPILKGDKALKGDSCADCPGKANKANASVVPAGAEATELKGESCTPADKAAKAAKAGVVTEDKAGCGPCGDKDKPNNNNAVALSQTVAYTQDGCGGCASKEVKAEAKDKELCCKSTAANPIAKGSKGCCNAKGALARFKVWADGTYHFFGCQGSASKARLDLARQGALVVGRVQPVVGRVAMV